MAEIKDSISMTSSSKNRGLNAFQLKIIALICMTVDHIGAIGFEIPFINQYAIYFQIIGRIAAPLFLFVLVQSIRYTRNKYKFILRLYLCGVGVSCFDSAINLLCGESFTYYTPRNILLTFFFVALYAVAIEKLIAACREKDIRTILISLCLIVISLFPTIFAVRLEESIPRSTSMSVRIFWEGIVPGILPTLFSVEYGIGFILLGLILYFAKTPKRQCVAYAVFCAISLVGTFVTLHNYDLQISFFGFFDYIQCHMVLALPIMPLYNGERGRKCKWLFYCYYPLHRQIIYWIFYAIVH